MKAGEHPTAFGVFKPVGHVVAAFPEGTDLDAVLRSLADIDVPSEAVVRLTPEQMIKQADGDLARASGLASIGQELNLVKAHRQLAAQGNGFLVIEAADDNTAECVAEVARRFNASRAQHYGRWMVEDLIDVGSTDRQVSESPDRGLDAQTRSGHERTN